MARSTQTLRVNIVGNAQDLNSKLGGLQGRMSKFGEGAKRVGGSLTKGLTLPLVGAAAAAVTVGMRFDDQMARVQAISGATGDELDDLRQTAQDLGSTTRYSATEAAEGLEYLALAGYTTSESINALPGILSLASAAGMDLGNTSDIVTDTMGAFGMSAEEAGRAADVFANQQATANTTVEQLGEAMAKAAPQANAAGMSLEETAAALGVMADQGVKGSVAGTRLNAILRDLVKNADDGAVQIGDMGVEVFDAEGNFRAFGDIMRDVETATRGMTDAQREQALRSIFQQQSITGVNNLLEAGSGTLAEYTSANRDAEGAAKSMSEIMENTLGGAFRAMGAQLEGIMIQLSDQLAPIMRDTVVPIIQTVGERISAAIEWFSGLDQGVKNVVLAVAAFAAALGPVLIGLGTMATVLAAVMSPALLVVGAIAALAAGLVYAYTQSETFRTIVQNAWQAVSTAIGVAVEWIKTTVSAFMDTIRQWWQQHGDQIMARVSALWDTVQALFATGLDLVKTIVSTALGVIRNFWEGFADPFLASVGRLWDNVTEYVSGAWNGIMNIIEGALTLVRGIWETFIGVFTGDWERAWNGIKDQFRGVWQVIVGIVQTVWATIKGVVSSAIEVVRVTINGALNVIKGIFKSAWDYVASAASTAWNSLVDTVSSKVAETVEKVRSLKDKITSFFSNAGSWLRDAGRRVIQGLINGIGSMIGAVGNKMSEVASSIRDRLPFSPAKAGPLRTHPPDKAGRKIGEMVRDGLGSVDVGTGLDPSLDGMLDGRTAASRARGGGGSPLLDYARRQLEELATIRRLTADAARDVRPDQQVRYLRRIVDLLDVDAPDGLRTLEHLHG